MKINDLSKDDLIQLLKDFVEGLEKCTDLSAEEQDFITLQKESFGSCLTLVFIK